MKGNFHVRFLGGLGRATAQAYPVRDTYEQHELRKSLPDMVFHEQVLLFAAGILWEQASGGRRKLLPEV